jgi:hypothetical protein
MIQVYHFLVLYLTLTTGLASYIFYTIHNQLSKLVLSIFFFLSLNILICIWEISLGINIQFIKEHFEKLKTKYKKKKADAVYSLMLEQLNFSKVFSLEFWAKIWST